MQTYYGRPDHQNSLYSQHVTFLQLVSHSLVPRPSLPCPAFNVACKKREEGLVRDVTHVMQRVDSR